MRISDWSSDVCSSDLYMSYAEMRRMHGVEQINVPSMFLKEIPPEHIVETRPRAQIVRPAFATRDYGRGPGGGGYGEAGERRGSYGARYDAPLLRTQVSARAAGNSEGPNGLRLGQNVRHEKFGEGTVLSFDGDGERTRIEVRLKTSGTK